jgi:hypothetical protein
MNTRPYNLYFASTSTGDAKANIRISAKGFITSLYAIYTGVAAAAIDGFSRFEISKQSSSNFTLNDAPNTVMMRFAFAYTQIASAAYAGTGMMAGCSHPVMPYDIIYAHQLIGGTAPTSGSFYLTIMVMES